MRLVAYKGIDLAGRSIAIVIKVLKHRLRAAAYELPKRLGKSAGSSRVVSGTALSEEACQKVDSEHGLTGPRTPSDYHYMALTFTDSRSNRGADFLKYYEL